MITFLILMHLLSLALGYAAAFDCSTRELWLTVRNNGMPETLKLALDPTWKRVLVLATCLAAILGIGYGFWQYGLLPGAGLAFCFILASKTGEMFLLHKMHSSFHLNLILRAVLRRQADYIRADDMERAKALAGLIEKVGQKLHAVKAVKSAALVPALAGNVEHLKVYGAKADNYHSWTRTRRGK
jgi:hypothetical protein